MTREIIAPTWRSFVTTAHQETGAARSHFDARALLANCHCDLDRPPFAHSRKIAQRRHFSVRFFVRFAIGYIEGRVRASSLSPSDGLLALTAGERVGWAVPTTAGKSPVEQMVGGAHPTRSATTKTLLTLIRIEPENF